MKAFYITAKGEKTTVDISRKQLIETFNIHNRDLRPVLSLKQVVTFFRRGKCLVVNLRSVKVLIGAKDLYVFNIENEKIAGRFVPNLLEKIGKRTRGVRFELLVLEHCFSYIQARVQEKFESIQKIVERLLRLLNKELKDENFEQLLVLKKKLSNLETTAQEMEEAIEEVIEDEEELDELHLTSSRTKSAMDEVESILENSLEQVEDIAHKIRELEENIDDTQEIITLKIANLRNTIIKFDLVVSALTGILALVAAVTGLYGMNLANHMETDPQAFFEVTLVLGLISLALALGIMIYLKRKKIL